MKRVILPWWKLNFESFQGKQHTANCDRRVNPLDVAFLNEDFASFGTQRFYLNLKENWLSTAGNQSLLISIADTKIATYFTFFDDFASSKLFNLPVQITDAAYAVRHGCLRGNCFKRALKSRGFTSSSSPY